MIREVRTPRATAASIVRSRTVVATTTLPVPLALRPLAETTRAALPDFAANLMTEKRQYSKAEKAAWGAEQDRIRAAGGIKAWRASKVSPSRHRPKRQSREKPLIADTSESECFDSLVYRKDWSRPSLQRGGAGTYEYEMSLAEAPRVVRRSEFGEYFNAEIR